MPQLEITSREGLPPDWKTLRRARALDLSGLPGLLVASVEDPTGSTGATLFRFPQGGAAAFDSRGGSVASSETELLTDGSYSHWVDGIVFAGGSTLGLAAADGVRRVLFRERAGGRPTFDSIPSVPSAVIYDYSGRVHAGADPLVFPDTAMGEALMARLEPRFWIGRAGAGSCATVQKIEQPRFGGQGAALRTYPWGTVFAAVILNPLGEIRNQGRSVSAGFPPVSDSSSDSRSGGNTTLSCVITDVAFDRNALKRIATMVHTSMGESIFPFHSEADGDIHFAVSLGPTGNSTLEAPVSTMTFAMAAAELMTQAILDSVNGSNP